MNPYILAIGKFSVSKDSSPLPIGMTEVTALYKKAAPDLAEKAALETIKNWRGKLKEITHVISVSSTGAISPGIELYLAQRLGMKENISLLGVNFMGSSGAIKGLKVASKIAKENPKNRILIVCTELSLADSSAGVIVGSEPRENENALFEIIDEGSFIIKDSIEDMICDAASEGFRIIQSDRIPQLVKENIGHFIRNFLGFSYKSRRHTWAISNEKAIIEAIEEGLNLDKTQTASSWDAINSLKEASSVSLFFILEDLSRNASSTDRIIGMSVGPGLCMEGLLLK